MQMLSTDSTFMVERKTVRVFLTSENTLSQHAFECGISKTHFMM
jgi:hypothetical protein